MNDPPVAVSQSVSTAEDTAKAITLAATDVDGDGLTYAVVSPPVHGVLSGTAPALTYTPDADYHGPDSFTFKVNDGLVDSSAATVSITVTPVNDAPVAVGDSLSTGEDTQGQVNVLGNDSDPDGDTVEVVTAFAPLAAHGTVSCSATGSCTYTPDANYAGPDSFEYSISDGHGGTDTATVTVTVTPVNDPPVLTVTGSPAGVQYSDVVGPISLSATDVDGDALVLSASGLPGGVTLTDNGDGTGSISGAVTLGAGIYPGTVSVSDGKATDSEPVRVDVSVESASLSYTGDTLKALAPGQSTMAVQLAAIVTQQDDGHPGDLSRARVFFDLYRSSNATMATPDVTLGPFAPSSTGAVSVTTTLAEDAWTVVVRFQATNAFFAGSPDAAGVTVYQPAAGKVTGGGWVKDPGTPAALASPKGAHASFGFIVQSKPGKTGVQGNANVVLHGTDGRRYVLRASSWAGGSLTITPDGRHASFSGKATITVFGPKGKEQTLTGADFQIDLTDNGSPGTADTLALSIWRDRTLYHQLGTTTTQLPLSGGNLTIHKK